MYLTSLYALTHSLSSWLTQSVTYSMLCPHNALLSRLKLVPGFWACFLLLLICPFTWQPSSRTLCSVSENISPRHCSIVWGTNFQLFLRFIIKLTNPQDTIFGDNMICVHHFALSTFNQSIFMLASWTQAAFARLQHKCSGHCAVLDNVQCTYYIQYQVSYEFWHSTISQWVNTQSIKLAKKKKIIKQITKLWQKNFDVIISPLPYLQSSPPGVSI